MGKRDQDQNHLVSEECDGHSENKKKKWREDESCSAVDQSVQPEHHRKKKKKQKYLEDHPEGTSKKSQKSQRHTNISEENDAKHQTGKSKKRKADSVNVITESERTAIVSSDRKSEKTNNDNEVSTVKKKKQKNKKQKTQRHSEVDETDEGRDTHSCSTLDSTIQNSCDELEEKRREERKQKKKDKKLELKNKESSVQESTDAGPNACQLALDYLSQWEKDREHWRFQKVRQVWLLHNMYDENKVDESSFKALLLYLDGLKGKSRETTVKQAENIIALDEDSDAETKDLSEAKLERARQLIQVLT